ncbi:MAG: hypothetical protein CL878_10240 [Dehalococcoidia bacterium]|nr:hypothetical protein [Dehalococcoidia bacterium]
MDSPSVVGTSPARRRNTNVPVTGEEDVGWWSKPLQGLIFVLRIQERVYERQDLRLCCADRVVVPPIASLRRTLRLGSDIHIRRKRVSIEKHPG